MTSGDIALLILEILGFGTVGLIVLMLLIGWWITATWGTGK